jgi:hypothetical protein
VKFKAKSEDTRHFIKLKSGESIQGVFRGDPYDFRIHWLKAESRSVVCDGKELCKLCASGDKSSFRFRLNFIVKEGEDYLAKVIEQGWTSYQALINLQESGYDLEKQIIQISRQGTGLNTSYSIIPSPKGMVTPDKEALINAVVLNDLGHVTEEETEPAEIPSSLMPPHTVEDSSF